MSTYAGQDPIPSPPVTAGAGTWPDLITIPDDGDPRAAASVNVALEGLADRTQWLAEHQVNGVDGGGPYLGPIIMLDLTVGPDGVLTVQGSSGHLATVAHGQYSQTTHAGGSSDTYGNGAVWTAASNSALTITSGAFVSWTVGGGGNLGTVDFGADGELTMGVNSSLVVTAGASVVMSVGGGGTPGSITINADGTLTTSASSDFNNGGTTTRTGPEILSGASAYQAVRIGTGPNSATANIDGRAQDILVVDTLGLASVYTLTNLSASETCRFKIRVTTTTALDIARASGTVIASFAVGAGNARTIEVYWNGSSWKVLDFGATFANL